MEQLGICSDLQTCENLSSNSLQQENINYLYPEEDNFTIPNTR